MKTTKNDSHLGYDIIAKCNCGKCDGAFCLLTIDVDDFEELVDATLESKPLAICIKEGA